MVLAALADWHDRNRLAAAKLGTVTRLPAQVLAEAYSVLTRLPQGVAARPGDTALGLRRVAPDGALTLDALQRAALPTTLAEAGVSGGAVYDAIVGLEAANAGETLLTLDKRALVTYERLGVAYELLEA